MTFDEPFLGIDFGTAYSAMAWVHPETGQAEVLSNAEGDEKTRSAVYFARDGVHVGRIAEECLEDGAEAGRVLFSMKREIAKKTVSMVDGKPFSPLDVAVKVFSKLKHDAEQTNFHRPVRRAVVTVPASFDPLQREAIENAAQQAGFEEVATLEEPVAAAIAYLKAGLDVGRRILVFDLGAGTFDAAVLDRTEDDIQPFQIALEPRGEEVGGDDFDRALMNHVLESESELASNPASLARLQFRCRRLKEALSQHEKHALSVPLPDGTTPRQEISRETFEDLIRELVASMVNMTDELVKQAEQDGGPVDTLVLIGGSSRIPLVARLLHERVPLQPRHWHRQDVAVALGAAYYGEILWGAKAAKTYREILRRIEKAEDLSLGILCGAERDRDRLELPSEQAERIEREELGDTLNRKISEERERALTQYEERLRGLQSKEVLLENDVEFLRQASRDLGLTSLEAENLEQAVLGHAKEELYTRQQETREVEAQDLLGRAKTHIKNKQLDEALPYTQAAIDANPREPEGHHLKVHILKQQEKWELVESAASVYLQLDSTDHCLRYERGLARLEVEKYPEARADFDEVLESRPDTDLHRHRWRAVASYRLGDIPGALADLEQAAADAEGCHKDQTPVAAVLTAVGLLCDRKNESALDDPAKAFDSLSAAFFRLPPPGALNERQCRQFVSLFDSRKPTARKRGHDSISSWPPKEEYRDFLQRKLWALCKKLHDKDEFLAVKQFHDVLVQAKTEVSEAVWGKDKTLGIAMMRLLSHRLDMSGAKKWVQRLIDHFDIDVSVLQAAPEVSVLPKLVDFLTPKWSYTVAYGVLENCIGVINESPFSLLDVCVTTAIRHNDGTVRTIKHQRIAKLGRGEEKQWDNVFSSDEKKEFNIFGVTCSLECRAGIGRLGDDTRDWERSQGAFSKNAGVTAHLIGKGECWGGIAGAIGGGVIAAIAAGFDMGWWEGAVLGVIAGGIAGFLLGMSAEEDKMLSKSQKETWLWGCCTSGAVLGVACGAIGAMLGNVVGALICGVIVGTIAGSIGGNIVGHNVAGQA